jgi:RimJ/RimL family protein N-acetyltransferase
VIAIATGKVQLVSPVPQECYALIRDWAHECPMQAYDDFWPRTLREFSDTMRRRAASECTYLVKKDDQPVGFIGYARLTPHLGSLRGVVFSKDVHGDGTAVKAMRSVLHQAFDEGVFKIMAFPFADNGRAVRFYSKLGAVQEALLMKHTLRRGKLIDVVGMAFFADRDGYGY